MIPRAFIKDGLPKGKECAGREEVEEATGKKGEDLEYFQQRKRKFITGLFVIADIKAQVPALLIGCESKVAMETIIRLQGRN